MQRSQERCFQPTTLLYPPWPTTYIIMAISPVIWLGSISNRAMSSNPWTVKLHGVSRLSPHQTNVHVHCFDFRRNRFPQVHWEDQLCVWSHLSFRMTRRSRQISVLVPLLRRPNSIGALISPFATAILPPSWRKLLVSLTLVVFLEFSAHQPNSTWKFIGTTLIYLASDAFTSYQQATGAVLDNDTGLLRLTRAQFRNLESLFFTIHGVGPLSFSPGE